MKIAFQTLGCKLNYAETSTYERGFQDSGVEVVDYRDNPDVILVNTCSVTQHSDNKCRNIIRKCHRVAPGARIVVAGCYASLRREEILAIEGVQKVFGATEKGLVVPETLSLMGIEDIPLSKEQYKADPFMAFSSGERTRSFLKVQDGCDNMCAYCTVPLARGRSRSPLIEEVIPQALQIARMGIREVVLTGVNTGDFGRKNGESFLDLLKRLNDIDGIQRYRISSIEPNLLSDDIIDWIASGTKFQPHFHIPLQSGDDEILRKVGRRYDTELFSSRIDRVRQKMGDDVFFGIDVIVGLPGEDEESFQRTYSFLEKRIRPAFIHIFPYSKRPGTRAYLMKDQIQDRIKTERVEKLEELCSILNKEFILSNKGRKALVLWESTNKDGMMSGYTGNYIRVEAPYAEEKVGTIEEVTI